MVMFFILKVMSTSREHSFRHQVALNVTEAHYK